MHILHINILTAVLLVWTCWEAGGAMGPASVWSCWESAVPGAEGSDRQDDNRTAIAHRFAVIVTDPAICPPCRVLDGSLQQLRQLQPRGWRFDGEQSHGVIVQATPEACQRYGVEGIPTVILYERDSRGVRELRRISGPLTAKQFTDFFYGDD